MVKNDKDEKIFDRIDSIIDMSSYSEELRDVQLTLHRNPEVEDSYVRIYHYIMNTSRQDRKYVAEQVSRN